MPLSPTKYKIPEVMWLSLPVKSAQPVFVSKWSYSLTKINNGI